MTQNVILYLFFLQVPHVFQARVESSVNMGLSGTVMDVKYAGVTMPLVSIIGQIPKKFKKSSHRASAFNLCLVRSWQVVP